ncbi:R3H domain-containing protein 1 [Smittium mucronatum]|uniref:R3H domain-containing protein 1 n=1 Tax=Smittium mucronatum TaxID=133383 RepID=A0A1R0GN93_9FUNG|nr:R3H domain-containing protein 1 [Smittium mucronatum]
MAHPISNLNLPNGNTPTPSQQKLNSHCPIQNSNQTLSSSSNPSVNIDEIIHNIEQKFKLNSPSPSPSPNIPQNQESNDLVDPMLSTYLGNPKDRLFILEIENKFIDFINSQEHQIALPPYSAYKRKAIHITADYYRLRHVTCQIKDVIVIYKLPESRVPDLKLKDYKIDTAVEKNSNSKIIVQKIMKRSTNSATKLQTPSSQKTTSPKSTSTSLNANARVFTPKNIPHTSHTSTPSIAKPIPKNITENDDDTIKIIKEKEKAYFAARKKIFDSYQTSNASSDSTIGNSLPTNNQSITNSYSSTPLYLPDDVDFNRNNFVYDSDPSFSSSYNNPSRINGQYSPSLKPKTPFYPLKKSLGPVHHNLDSDMFPMYNNKSYSQHSASTTFNFPNKQHSSSNHQIGGTFSSSIYSNINPSLPKSQLSYPYTTNSETNHHHNSSIDTSVHSGRSTPIRSSSQLFNPSNSSQNLQYLLNHQKFDDQQIQNYNTSSQSSSHSNPSLNRKDTAMMNGNLQKSSRDESDYLVYFK